MIIDNSFKYFANYRDNWYWTIILSNVASFAAYLNRGVTFADFQSSRNIPLAKELLNVIEIIWGAIKSISWLDIPSGLAPLDLSGF